MFLISFLLFIQFAFATDEVEIKTSEKEIAASTGKTVSIDLTIKNNQIAKDRFQILISPRYWVTGISAEPEKERVDVEADSSAVVKVYFKIPDCINNMIQKINITVISGNVKSISSSQIVNLNVIGGSPICLKDLKLEKYVYNPGESVRINSEVESISSEPSDIYYLQVVIKSGDEVIHRFDKGISLPPKSKTEVEDVYEIDKYMKAGVYEVTSTLMNVMKRAINSKHTTFRVNSLYKITQHKNVSTGFLIQTATIIVKNEGNEASASFYVTESVPSFMKQLFQPVGKYTIEQSYDRIMYHWLMPSLKPGEERIVEYQINLWNVWIIIILLGAFIALGYKYVFTPTVKKRHSHRGALTKEKEVKVSIEVKNRSRHEINEVLVRDFVPSIVKVLDKFDTLRPIARKTSGGIELLWKIKSLKPREERVLTYRVKPVIEIGEILKLPKARVKYVDKKKTIKAIASKSIAIKTR